MSEQADIFASFALPVLVDTYKDAASVEITPAGGTSTTYDSLVHAEERIVEDDNGRRSIKFTRKVFIESSSLTTIQSNAKAVVDGNTYHVVPTRLSSGMWELELTRTQLSEVSRPGYRSRA